MKYRYGKNVFLTGGSSGIGRAAAELLAENGYTVFAASRNPPEAIVSYPSGGEIRPVAMDVRDLNSVDSVAAHILAETDIGIVVHCAGVGIACAGEDFPVEDVGWLMETNFFGVLRVNSRFLSHLRKRGCGLCVIVGSVAGMIPIPFQSHYCASKAALDLYSSTLRIELREYGVKVCLLMPGDTSTGFTNARKYAIDEASPFYSACLLAVKKMENDELNGHPPKKVARAILKLSTKPRPPARTIVGAGYKIIAFLKRLLPYKSVEFIIRAMYMKRSI